MIKRGRNLVITKFLKRKNLIHNLSDENKLIIIFRFLTLSGTSVFYFIGNANYNILNKFFLVFCLSISSIILNYLYIKNQEYYSKILLLIFIETIGNCFILIPLDGLNSLFVWYALNTFLIASFKLNLKYCLINLILYISISVSTTYFLLNTKAIGYIDFIKNESNLIIGFILVFIAMQFLSVFIKRLQTERSKLVDANKQLITANERLKESLEHIMSLYQTVNTFVNQKDKEKLIMLLLEGTKKITKSNNIFYYNYINKRKELIFLNNDVYLKKMVKEKIDERLDVILKSEIPITINFDNKSFVIMTVKSTYSYYGILGIDTTFYKKEKLIYNNILYIIKFLADLSSIVLENSYLEEVKERSLKTEEQNRIANEIHDSILQRLFALSTSMYLLIRKLDDVSIKTVREDLNDYRNVLNNAMKDLRSTIYRLSWNKKGNNSFVQDIKRYINEIKNLDHIDITFELIGQQEILLPYQKQAIYRIICESIGNSVRHGKASQIDVKLDINFEYNYLTVIDNGTGFDVEKIRNSKCNGIGIRNIKNLTHSLNGEIKINSIIEVGTTVKATIPNKIRK